jgi:hypothetical protein
LMFDNKHLDNVTEGYRSQNPDERPGRGNIRITNVEVDVTKKDIEIKITAKVKKEVPELIYGLSVMGEDGREVTGFNNQSLMSPNIINLKKGSEIKFEWNVQNIFKSGEYSLTLSLVGEQIRYDDFVDAAFFKVEKQKYSNTAVLPEVSIKHKIV